MALKKNSVNAFDLFNPFALFEMAWRIALVPADMALKIPPKKQPENSAPDLVQTTREAFSMGEKAIHDAQWGALNLMVLWGKTCMTVGVATFGPTRRPSDGPDALEEATEAHQHMKMKLG